MSNRMRVSHFWFFALLALALVVLVPQAYADQVDEAGQTAAADDGEAALGPVDTGEEAEQDGEATADTLDEGAAEAALLPQQNVADPFGGEAAGAAVQDQATEATPEPPAAEVAEPALEAQASTVASGKCGTCPWSLNSAGKLTISAGELASNKNNKPDFWPWHAYRSSIKSVVLSGEVYAGASMAYIFQNCTKLTSVNFDSLTGDYIDFRYAFAGCTSLATLGTKAWHNWIYLTSTSHMFSGCTSLTSADFSVFSTEDLRDVSYMFSGCTSLTTVGLEGIDPMFNPDFTGVLEGCTKITKFVNKWCNQSVLDMLPTGVWTIQGTSNSYVKDRDGWVGEPPEDGNYTLVKTAKVPQTIIVRNTVAVVGRETNLWVTVPSGNTPTYELADTSLATVDETGVVTGVAAGTTTLTITLPETEEYARGELVVDLTVVEPDQLEMVASGTCGTCPWELDATGTLTISSGMLPSNNMIENGLYSASFWPWHEYRDRIVTVAMAGEITCSGCLSKIFADCPSLVFADFSGWDLTNAYSTEDIFLGCSSLKYVRADGLVFGSSFQGFIGMTSLVSIEGMDSWDTSRVTSMQDMFSGCTSLRSLDLSGWDTSAVGSMRDMFSGCTSLASLEVAGWDTSCVTSMTAMFKDCAALASIDLAGWDTSQVTEMNQMFAGCGSLASIDVSSLQTGSVTNMADMFNGCTSLTALDLSGLNTQSVTWMRDMLRGCTSLVSLDISGWDLTGLQENQDDPVEVEDIFANNRLLEHIKAYNLKFGSRLFTFGGLRQVKEIEGVESWDVSQLTTMNDMFAECQSLTSLDLSRWDTSNVTSMSDAFRFCKSLSHLNLSGWNTSRVTSMESMFESCSALQGIDVSGFDTSHVKYFGSMFYGCESLAALDVSHFDTSAGSSMGGMFHGCKRLKALDVTGFKTSSAKSMSGMFADCTSLTSLDISKLDTSSVQYFSSMFANCTALKSLDVSKMDTSSAKSFETMFINCKGLKTLDVSKWSTAKVTDLGATFSGCSSLTSLDISKWNLAKLKFSAEMLDGCTKLTKLAVGTKSAKVAQALPLGTWTAKSSKKAYVKGATTGEDAWVGAKPPTKTADTYTKTGKGAQSVIVSAKTVAVGSTVALGAKATGGGKLSYKSADTALATVSSKGVVKGKKAGKVTITVTAAATSVCSKATKKVTVTVKKANPLTAKAKKKTVKAAYSKVKSKAVTLASNITVSKAQGKVTYKNASSDAAAKKIKINKTTGKITVPKGMAKGTYTVKVAVKAAGNATYAARTRNVTFKIKVS